MASKPKKKLPGRWPRTLTHRRIRGRRRQEPLGQTGRILIITEGKETEPNYFNGLFLDQRIYAETKFGNSGAKLGLIEKAEEKTKEAVAADEYDPKIDKT